MKLGAYTACLHDKTLEEALKILQDLGLTSAEVNAGGFIGTPHLPVDELLESESAREEYLATFARYGITLTALNCNGNPLHPDPEVGKKHSDDLRRAIELGGLLGVRRVITMSGLPGTDPAGTRPSWTVIPWDSVYKETLDYQWDQVAIPFWTEIQALAAEHDVKVCIEMHPHNIVFNPATLKRLVERTGATHVGAEMDPSHLFWQHIDPVAAVEDLGSLVFFAAAKDTLIHTENARSTESSTTGSNGSRPRSTRSGSAGATPSHGGRRLPDGPSSPWVAATTSTSGRGSCRRFTPWIRTCRSTSSTRTPRSDRSRD